MASDEIRNARDGTKLLPYKPVTPRYTVMVPAWRLTRLSRVVAVCLLLWTAVDLADAGACALDQEQFGGSTAASVQSIPTAAEHGSGPFHVDDCFCCSHCVDVDAVVVLPAISSMLQPVCATCAKNPRARAFPLFHPPDTSLL